MLVIAGANVFTWFLHTEGTPFPRGLRVMQIDDDPWEIGRSLSGRARHRRRSRRRRWPSWPARCAAGCPRPSTAAAAARVEKIGKARAELMQRVRAAAQAEVDRITDRSGAPHAHPRRPCSRATRSSSTSRRRLFRSSSATCRSRHPGSFYGGKTGTLGWGMGAAIGVQLGSPGRKVVATIGDGSADVRARRRSWTAAHYRLPITYVVPNNSSYAILKSGMLSLDLASAKRGIYPGMDLVEPDHRLRRPRPRSLGVRAERVEKPAEPSRRARRMPRAPRPGARRRRDRSRLQGNGVARPQP